MTCTIFQLVGSPNLWQWDTGRQLSVTDPEGYEIHKVHFGSGDTQTAPAVDVDRDTMTVNIPNSLLQSSGRIRVYAMNQTENSEVTIHSHTLFIKSREKPAGYVVSEDEIKRWDDLEGRISELEQKAVGSTQVIDDGAGNIILESMASSFAIADDSAGNIEIVG